MALGQDALEPGEDELALWEVAHGATHPLSPRSSWMEWIISELLQRVGVGIKPESSTRVFDALLDLKLVKHVESSGTLSERRACAPLFFVGDINANVQARVKQMEFLDEMRIHDNLTKTVALANDPTKQAELLYMLETGSALASQYLMSHPSNKFVKGPLSCFFRCALALTKDADWTPICREVLEDLQRYQFQPEELPMGDLTELFLNMTKDQLLVVALHYRHYDLISLLLKSKPSLAYFTDKQDGNALIKVLTMNRLMLKDAISKREEIMSQFVKYMKSTEEINPRLALPHMSQALAQFLDSDLAVNERTHLLTDECLRTAQHLRYLALLGHTSHVLRTLPQSDTNYLKAIGLKAVSVQCAILKPRLYQAHHFQILALFGMFLEVHTDPTLLKSEVRFQCKAAPQVVHEALKAGWLDHAEFCERNCLPSPFGADSTRRRSLSRAKVTLSKIYTFGLAFLMLVIVVIALGLLFQFYPAFIFHNSTLVESNCHISTNGLNCSGHGECLANVSLAHVNSLCLCANGWTGDVDFFTQAFNDCVIFAKGVEGLWLLVTLISTVQLGWVQFNFTSKRLQPNLQQQAVNRARSRSTDRRPTTTCLCFRSHEGLVVCLDSFGFCFAIVVGLLKLSSQIIGSILQMSVSYYYFEDEGLNCRSSYSCLALGVDYAITLFHSLWLVSVGLHFGIIFRSANLCILNLILAGVSRTSMKVMKVATKFSPALQKSGIISPVSFDRGNAQNIEFALPSPLSHQLPLSELVTECKGGESTTSFNSGTSRFIEPDISRTRRPPSETNTRMTSLTLSQTTSAPTFPEGCLFSALILGSLISAGSNMLMIYTPAFSKQVNCLD